MTPDQGYEKAKHMTVGYFVSMGVTSAKMKRMKSLTYYEKTKSGIAMDPHSWLGYDLGFEPSPWVKWFVFSAKFCFVLNELLPLYTQFR